MVPGACPERYDGNIRRWTLVYGVDTPSFRYTGVGFPRINNFRLRTITVIKKNIRRFA